MSKTDEKPLYPSQINTKAIACRISSVDYVKFLQEAISQGISLNDWLLMKIYSNNNVSKGDADLFMADVQKASPDEFLFDCKELFNIQINKEGKPYITYEIESDYVRKVLNMEIATCKNIKELTTIISFEAIALGKYPTVTRELNEHKKEKVTISDIRAQLMILAEKTFQNKKDVREFMKDINEVLADLEN